MSDEELLEMYEREWKSLMNKVNEVEENIVQIRKRITSNAAQQSVHPTGGTVPPLVEFLANPENYPTAEQGSRPTTSG